MANKSFPSKFYVALLMGVFVRLIYPLGGAYPLNDGGLFFTMVEDLQNSSNLLPDFTSYNYSQIPYAYPPLAFFLTGLLHNLTRIHVIALVRLLPPLISSLALLAFYRLAWQLLANRREAVLATLGFALLPMAFDPLIVGAGLTRAPGFVFALLTLAELNALYTTLDNKHLVWTIVFASLTVLSHPGMAWFTAYSSLILLLFKRQRALQRLKISFWAAAGTIVLTAPWWLTIMLRHGFKVLLSPFQAETFSITAFLLPFSFLFTNEPLVTFWAVFCFLGIAICLQSGQWHLPAWLLGVFVFDPRLGAVYTAAPTAFLAAIGLKKALSLEATNQAEEKQNQGAPIKIIALGFLLLYGTVAAYLVPQQYERISPEQAEVMRWVEENTVEESSFLVVTGSPSYGKDYTSEWFPALSKRKSIATPQGHEWLPGKVFKKRVQLHTELQTCAGLDISCLEELVTEFDLNPTHIYISKKALSENGFDSEKLIASLDKPTRPLYKNSTALIYKWP